TGAGMVWRAAAAIATGMCTTCLCVTAARRERRRPDGAGGGGSRRPNRDRSPAAEFEAPYGAVGANAAYAMIAMRYQHEYNLPHRPAWRLGAGEMVTHTSLPWAPSLTDTAIAPAAESAFAIAQVKPGDIGLASLYDCYTIAVALTLEDAGFCAKGEAGAFIE